VKHSPIIKQPYQHTGAFTLANFSTKLQEQRLYISPLNIRTDRPVEYQLDCSLVFALHAQMILFIDTMSSSFHLQRHTAG